MAPPLRVAPWLPCPECSAPLDYAPASIQAYLVGQPVSCPHCKKSLDWWRAVVHGIEKHFQFGQVMAMAGCETLLFGLDVPAGEAIEVDLAPHGVPDDAEIVYMNLTATGGVWPLLVRGNDVLREPLDAHFWLYGRPMRTDSVGSGVTMMVTWFARRADDTVVRHLVDAARQYQAERFDALIVPANIAAEASLAPVLSRFFATFGSKRSVEEMLNNGATYSHQLNVLVNVVANAVALPRLSDHIRGLLNRLRGLRNQIAHEGHCAIQSRRDAAEHLAAAFFMIHYVALLRAGLSKAKEKVSA